MIAISLTILLLLTVAAFLSAAETALTAASKPLLHQLHEEGNQRAGTVNRLLDQREHMISTVLLGNNLVNILASALTTSAMIESTIAIVRVPEDSPSIETSPVAGGDPTRCGTPPAVPRRRHGRHRRPGRGCARRSRRRAVG